MWTTSGLINSVLGLILLYGTTAAFRFPNEGRGRPMPRTSLVPPPPPRGTRHFTGGHRVATFGTGRSTGSGRYWPQTAQQQVTSRQNRFRFPKQRQQRSHLQTPVQTQVTSRQHPRPRALQSSNNPPQNDYPVQGPQLGQTPFHQQINSQPLGHAQVPAQQHIYTDNVHFYNLYGSQFNPGNVGPPYANQDPNFGVEPRRNEHPPAVGLPQGNFNSNRDPWSSIVELGAGVAERVAMAGLTMGFRALTGDGLSDGSIEPPYNIRDPNFEGEFPENGYPTGAELPQGGLNSNRDPRGSSLADLVAGVAIAGISTGVRMLAGDGLGDGVPQRQHRAFG